MTPRVCPVRVLAAGCLVLSARTSVLWAQSRPLELSGAVPDAPAFAFLSATPKQIERPGSLRDLGAAMQNGVNVNGKATAGFSLDASVWNLLPSHSLTLARYQNNRLAYMLANLQASLATVQSAGDTASLVSAIGLRTVIFDGGDPMANPVFTASLKQAARACLPQSPDAPPMGPCLDTATVQAVSEWTKSRWNSTQLSASAALGTRFAGGRLRRMAYSGMEAWLTGSTGLGSRIMLLGQTSYKHRQSLDTLPSYTAVNVGARAVFGSPVLTTFLEFGREWRAIDRGTRLLQIDRHVGGWSAGLEMRIAPNTWISSGLGTRYDALVPADRTQLFAGLKWGMTSQSRLRTMQDR